MWQSGGLNERYSLVSSTGALPASKLLQKTDFALPDQDTLANLYERVLPSVVNIQVTSPMPGLSLPSLGGAAPLEQSLGSGFIYDNEGHIVTNNHVIENAQSVLVVFSNGYWTDATVVAADPQADLAVIKVQPPVGLEWRPLPLEDADTLRVGYHVIAIGNPFGLNGTMTLGIVSALGRGVPVGDTTASHYTLPDAIQTDAAINPGNSGGPLLDLNGKVVGINFAIRSEVHSNVGVGFAIPVSIVRRVIPALIANGQFGYGYLGLSGLTIDDDLATAASLQQNVLGAYVIDVTSGGPADIAGIRGGSEMVTGPNGTPYRRGGDIITAIGGVPIQRFEDLVSYLVTKSAPGDKVTLTLLRDGKQIEADVVLGERPHDTIQSQTASPSGKVNEREAIAIAVKVVADSGRLKGSIIRRLAVPHQVGGVSVWIVELSTNTQTATVTVDVNTGAVLNLTVK